MKNLLVVLVLLASSTSFAAILPKCDSGLLDKWGRCAEDSPVGQQSVHGGKSYCLNPCNKTYEEMVVEAQAKAQRNADDDIYCGFKNVKSSEWSAPVTSEIVEGSRSWAAVAIQARFTCQR